MGLFKKGKFLTFASSSHNRTLAVKSKIKSCGAGML